MSEAGLTLDSDDIRIPNPDGWFYDDSVKDWRCALWAENWPPISLFQQNSTQWRIGVNGPIGLDYAVFFHELDRQGLSKDEYDDLMGCIRAIEGEALKQLRS